MSCSDSACPVGQACALDGPAKGTCVESAFVTFAAGPPLAGLPSCMRTALNNSMAGRPTAQDDAVMGAMGQPVLPGAQCDFRPIVPYCQQAQYMRTAYCACQNSTLPNAECVSVACQGLAAYKTRQQQQVAADPERLCPHQNVCQNIIAGGGAHNVTHGDQSINCGGTVQQFTAQLRLHPAAAVLVFVLVILLAAAVISPATSGRGRKPSVRPLGPLPGLPSLD